MLRRPVLLVLCSLAALGVPPAPASAQDPTPAPTEVQPLQATPTPAPETAPDGDDDVLDSDEIPPESTPDPTDEEDCVPGPGADGDAIYCLPCTEAGEPTPDGDYAYCQAGGGGGIPDGRDAEVEPLADEIRSVPAGRLPLTGGVPLEPALFGLGFLLLGAGLHRLGRPAARR